MRQTKNCNEKGDKIEGRVYSFNLEQKKVENKESKNFGQEYISGSISIATDDACTNVVEIHYTYVTPKFSSGKENSTYAMLKKLMTENKTVEAVGKDQAMQVSATPAINVNDFYTDRNGEITLVSAKRLEGGFLNTPFNNRLNSENARMKLTVDMYITGLEDKEDYHNVNGYIFNYRGAIMPVTFTVRNEAIISALEKYDISKQNPLFTQVRVRVNVSEVKTQKKSDGSFIGESEVREYTNVRREYLITDIAKNEYKTDDETEGVTAKEIADKMKEREEYLATVKKRFDDYRTTKSAAVTANIANEKFDF